MNLELVKAKQCNQTSNTKHAKQNHENYYIYINKKKKTN